MLPPQHSVMCLQQYALQLLGEPCQWAEQRRALGLDSTWILVSINTSMCLPAIVCTVSAGGCPQAN
jgi:hypothetical protein